MTVAIGMALLAAVGVSAQVAEVSSSSVCRLVDVHAKSGGTPLLYVACAGSSAYLGKAVRYRTATDPVSGGVVVALDDGMRTRVVQVAAGVDGAAHPDDVTAGLTKGVVAPRGPDLATIDLDALAASVDLRALAARARAISPAIAAPDAAVVGRD